MRSLLVCLFLLTPLQATAAQEGQRVFDKTASSVFLVEMIGGDGKTVATGTAFLVAPKTLITNAHVVRDGECHLRTATVRLRCAVNRIDGDKDLALISVKEELLASPLPFASKELSAGSTIYVVSNPLGMERTISQGLQSGVRTVDGETLLQVSAAISPGSSGGPVLNVSSEVVGVIVGSMSRGQLVNFAVPSKAVMAFIEGTTELTSFDGFKRKLTELLAAQDRLEYSDEPNSKWQLSLAEERSLLKTGMTLAKSPQEFLYVADSARWTSDELALSAARSAVAGRPALAKANILLAELLQERAVESSRSSQERSTLLAEAFSQVQKALALAGSTEETLYTLGQIQVAYGRHGEAYESYRKAQGTAGGATSRVAVGLIETAVALGKKQEALKRVEEFTARKDESVFSYVLLATTLDDKEEYSLAARLWDRAAELGATVNWCEAAMSWWFAYNDDEALGSARACVADESSKAAPAKDRASSHRIIGRILLKRGLADEALVSARRALDLDNQDARTWTLLADANERLGRNLEAIDAAKTALRLSDGKFGEMHFTLGSAYFNLKRWQDAKDAYEMAAKQNPEDFLASYNVAMCLVNMDRRQAAIYWLEETLRRRPDAEAKADAERYLRSIRGGLGLGVL